jgi:hypothetical protein
MVKGSSTYSRVHSSPFGLKKMLIFSVNGVVIFLTFCSFARVFGRNVDKAKMEVKVGVEDFLMRAFEKFYITI